MFEPLQFNLAFWIQHFEMSSRSSNHCTEFSLKQKHSSNNETFRSVQSDQCDHIWQNFATLALNKMSMAIL